jgi:hypothetical protein
MGLLKNYKKYIISFLMVFAVLVPSITAHAGYTSWDQVPADKKENAKAFFLSLREEGVSKEVAAAMTARANSESGFDPFMLEGGESSWQARLKAPEHDSPPAYGFLQMQDRSSGGRLGKMLAFVEQFEGGKGTSDPKVSARAQAKAALEEFKSHDIFASYPVKDAGGSAVVTTTGVSYPINLKDYGYTEPIDSFEKFKALKGAKLATLVWTMSAVRPSGDAYAGSYKNDFAMIDPILKEFGSLAVDGSSGSGDKVDADLGSDGLPKEWELVGMSKRKYLYESQNKLDLPSSDSGLTVKQRQHLASIKEDVTSVDGFNLITFLRTLVAFVGILFFVWAIFLMVAYLFDRSNIFFEVSLVSILTFGSITVLALDETDSRKVNASTIAKRVILALVIGYVLVAGVMYSGLDWLFQIIQSWINKI